MWLDDMVKQKPCVLARSNNIPRIFNSVSSSNVNEEPEYFIIKTEVCGGCKYKANSCRSYIWSEGNDLGYFDYISGANKSSKEVEMTIPVTNPKKLT